MRAATAAGALLHALGQIPLGKEDRDTEDDERDAVPDAPPGAEPSCRPRDALSARCDEGRHRRDVIRIGRVPEAEGASRGGRSRPTRPPRGLRSSVEPERALVRRARAERFDHRTPGSARAVMTRPTARIRRTPRRQGARERAIEREATEGPAAEDRDETDGGDSRRQAQAERHDQGEAEADPVQRDRRQEDDERGGARQQAGCDADPQNPFRGQGIVCSCPWSCSWSCSCCVIVIVIVVMAVAARPESFLGTAAPTRTTSSPDTSVSHG